MPVEPPAGRVFQLVLGVVPSSSGPSERLAGGEMSTVDHAMDARVNPPGEDTPGGAPSGLSASPEPAAGQGGLQ